MLYEESQMKEKSSAARMDILSAGITGMLAGAAGITLLALSDKDIRKKVLEHAHTAKELFIQWSSTKLHEPKEQTEETIEESIEVKGRDMHN